MTFDYSVYSGAGNRFLLSCTDISNVESALHICRTLGLDGVLWVLPSDQADARLVIFNDDGSRPSMCGNGLRCTMAHVAALLSKKEIAIETDSGIYQGIVYSSDRVVVDMTLPSWQNRCCLLSHTLPELPSQVVCMHTGVPHLVVFVQDVSKIEMDVHGSFLRNHPDFAPDGVNVNFVQSLEQNRFLVRTYERGVERETLACGTGAVAVALTAFLYGHIEDTTAVIQTWGGEILIVSSCHERIYLEGAVVKEEHALLHI